LSTSSLLIWLLGGAVALVAALYGLHRYHRRRRREKIRERDRQLDALRREHTDRVERLRRERDRARETGHIDFVESLLPALDGLRRAGDSLDDPPEEVEPLVEGLEMARNDIDETLRSHGIERIDPEPDDAFEPERHEALRAVDDGEAEPGTVVECHRPGYRFGDRTLRPAAVAVSVAADEASTEESTRASEGVYDADPPACDASHESVDTSAKEPVD
jgi:molecular chaperone GrpE